jgi:hypothetical protein
MFSELQKGHWRLVKNRKTFHPNSNLKHFRLAGIFTDADIPAPA